MENFVEHEGPVTVSLQVIPKKPFLQWLNGIEKSMGLDATEHEVLKSETNIYLVSLDSYEEEIEEYIDGHYKTIFRNELETWSLEVDKWPSDIDIEMFEEWFEYKVHNLINLMKVE